MSRQVQFNRKLDHLFHKRIYWLRNALGSRPPGAAPKLDRKTVSKAITKLQQLASEALAPKLARIEFSRAVEKKKSWHVKRGKGWGREEKKRKFNDWYEKQVGFTRCVYAFWNKRKSVYVGKTKGGGGRPSSHFEKYWFSGITRIDIYALRGKRSLPCLECLAIHRFQPSRNEQKAQSLKWTKKCPLCKVHRDIRNELRSIFRLR